MNCPKHVEFSSKYKFEKLVHLVGFIISIFFYLFLSHMFLVYFSLLRVSLFCSVAVTGCLVVEAAC